MSIEIVDVILCCKKLHAQAITLKRLLGVVADVFCLQEQNIWCAFFMGKIQFHHLDVIHISIAGIAGLDAPEDRWWMSKFADQVDHTKLVGSDPGWYGVG